MILKLASSPLKINKNVQLLLDETRDALTVSMHSQSKSGISQKAKYKVHLLDAITGNHLLLHIVINNDWLPWCCVWMESPTALKDIKQVISSLHWFMFWNVQRIPCCRIWEGGHQWFRLQLYRSICRWKDKLCVRNAMVPHAVVHHGYAFRCPNQPWAHWISFLLCRVESFVVYDRLGALFLFKKFKY